MSEKSVASSGAREPFDFGLLKPLRSVPRPPPSDLMSFGSVESGSVKKRKSNKKTKVLTPAEEARLIAGRSNPIPIPAPAKALPSTVQEDTPMALVSASDISSSSYIHELNDPPASNSRLDKTIAAASATFDAIKQKFHQLEQDNQSRTNTLAEKQEKTIAEVNEIISTVRLLIESHKQASDKAVENRNRLDILWDSCESMRKAMHAAYTEAAEINKNFRNDMEIVRSWATNYQEDIKAIKASINKDMEERLQKLSAVEVEKLRAGYKADHNGLENLVGGFRKTIETLSDNSGKFDNWNKWFQKEGEAAQARIQKLEVDYGQAFTRIETLENHKADTNKIVEEGVHSLEKITGIKEHLARLEQRLDNEGCKCQKRKNETVVEYVFPDTSIIDQANELSREEESSE